jgi:hypothetical protein
MATIQKLGGGTLTIGGTNAVGTPPAADVQGPGPTGQIFNDGFGMGLNNSIMPPMSSTSGSSGASGFLSMLQGFLGMLGPIGSMISSAISLISGLFGKK